MGQLTIRFWGVSAHIKNTPPIPGFEGTSLPAHRTVVISNPTSYTPPGTTVIIPAHVPSFQSQQVTDPTQLTRLGTISATLSVANPGLDIIGDDSYSACYTCAIWSLTKLAKPLVPLLNPTVGASMGTGVPFARYFFDFTQGVGVGKFDALITTPAGASVAVITVNTIDDLPSLNVMPWSGPAFPPIQFNASPAILDVSNSGQNSELETNADFLLNYLVTTSMPPRGYPDTGPIGCTCPTQGGDLGPGCSNSNYP